MLAVMSAVAVISSATVVTEVFKAARRWVLPASIRAKHARTA